MFFIIKVDIKNKDDAESIYNINNFNDQDSLVDTIITKLKKSFPEPERTFKRLGQTNFLTISTLPTETKENMKSWILSYNIKLNTLKGFNLTQADNTLTITFNSMSKPQYKYISDEYFKDEELVESLQSFGVNLSNLNTPENNLNAGIFNELHYIGANFANSHLNEASIMEASFVAANFSQATLQGANFYDTDLRKANFYDTDLTPYLKADGTLKKSSLNGAILKYADLSKAKLNGADLEVADLRGALLTGTDFRGCNMAEAKLYGTNWQDSLHDANLETDADFEQYDDYIDLSTPATIAEKAADIENAGRVAPQDRLAPLEIDLFEVIPESKSQTTYNDIVQLLLPKINKMKLPLSEMQVYKWYGIARLGTTSLDVWTSVGLVGKVPAIGVRFKCTEVPAKTMGEAQVYESGPDCMAIHELVRGIDIGQVVTTFKNIVGAERLQKVTLADDSEELLIKVTQELYQLIVFLLGYHLADEPMDESPDDSLEGAWTRYYNTGPASYQQRKNFVKHAIYHKDEGLIHHPFFSPEDIESDLSSPENLLIIIEFIKMLPLQVQVAWAQHYIKEFITGYNQTLKNFDPTRKSAEGFIASCINGNFEKLLLAFPTGIVQMAKAQPPEPETAADQRQNLINAFTHSEFEKYFTQERDIDGPTIERYKQYIEKNDIINPDLKAQYLLLFEDPLVIKQLEEIISIMSGGAKRSRSKHMRKTRKNPTNKIYKHILKKIKRKTHKKQKQKQKKTHKKPKKTHKTHKNH